MNGMFGNASKGHKSEEKHNHLDNIYSQEFNGKIFPIKKKKKKAESYSEEKNKTSDTHKNIFKTK